MAEQPRFTVIGEGKGGLATAGGIAIKGFEVNFVAQPELESFLRPMQDQGGIRVTGILGEGMVKLNRITTDVAAGLEQVDVVVIVCDAARQKYWAQRCGPHLRDGQIVLLHPGNGGGALEFDYLLRQQGNRKDVPIAETAGFFYVNRKLEPGAIEISALKYDLPTAALPGRETERVVSIINQAFVSLSPATNVIETSISQINHFMHPCQVIFNVGRIEDTGGDFGLYTQAVTPSVAKYIEKLDAERLAVGRACGLEMPTFLELLLRFYGPQGCKGSSVHDAMHSFDYYRASRAKPSINNRLLTEDVPYGILFVASLGSLVGVPTPCHDAIVTVAGALLDADYWKEGRTVDKVGIAGMSAQRLAEFVTDGM